MRFDVNQKENLIQNLERLKFVIFLQAYQEAHTQCVFNVCTVCTLNLND